MSSLIRSSKVCHSLLVAMTLVLVCVQLSFAKDLSGVYAALKTTSLQEVQILQVLKKIDRTYSQEDVEAHIRWLQNYGFQSSDQLMEALPIVLPHSIEQDLEKKLTWLNRQGVQNVKILINFYPELLGASVEYELNPKVRWLKRQGIKDTKKILGAFSGFLARSIADDLEPLITELKTYWKIGSAEIENSPELLGSGLKRIRNLKLFLDGIAKLAGDSHFDFNTLSIEDRKSLIRSGSAMLMFDSLSRVGAIKALKIKYKKEGNSNVNHDEYNTHSAAKVQVYGNVTVKRTVVSFSGIDAIKVKEFDGKKVPFSKISPSDRNILAQLYREGKLQELLSYVARANGMIPPKHKEIAAYIESLPRIGRTRALDERRDLEAFLKREGFAYIERKKIIEQEPGRRKAYSVKEVKDHLGWFNKQGLKTTEELTRALLVLARYPVETDLQPKIDYLLRKELGLKDAASLLRSSPESLARALEDIQDKILWAGNQGSTDVKKLLNTWPQFLKLSLEENLKPTVAWLQSLDASLDVGKVINSQPNLLGSSLEHQLKPVGNWLTSLEVKDMAKLLSAYPRILTNDLENTLKPRADWFREHGAPDIGKLLDKFPAVLGYSIKNNNDFVLWLDQHGVKDIGKVLRNFPQAVSYSIADKLNPKAQWFIRHKFKDMGAVITQFPVVLGLDIEDNLDPKLEEFKTHWGIGVPEIEEDPMFLIASNDNMKDLRLFLDDIAKMAGDDHFDLKSLTLEQRKAMVQKLKARDVFERLKQTGAISSERTSLAELTSSERQIVVELYRKSELMQKLISRASTARGLKPVTCYIDALKEKLSIQ